MKINKPKNLIDLHIHSTYSDGTMSTGDIIDLAIERGLQIISITDHDTVFHINEAVALGKEKGIKVVPGLEVSADYNNQGTMHILGYFINPDDECLFDMLQKFREGRDVRNPKIIKKLNELGIDIKYEEVLKEAGGISIGRPHIAKVLFDKGYVKDLKEAFTLYLAKGAKAYFDRFRLSPETIIKTIHKAGGLAFLAHPKQLNCSGFNALDEVVKGLIDKGLDGIEVYSSCHSAKDIKDYLLLAEKYNLLISGGSDFHGESKRGVSLGWIGENVALEVEIVDGMERVMKG